MIYLNACGTSNPSLYAGWVFKDIDILIAPSAINVPTAQMEDYLLHELGHAQTLNHSKNPNINPATSQIIDQYLMYYDMTLLHSLGYNNSIKSEDKEGALKVFSNSNSVITSNTLQPCNVSAIEPNQNCGSINSLQEKEYSSAQYNFVIPNPNNGDFELLLPENIKNEVDKIEIFDILGRRVFFSNEVNFQLNHKLENSLYFLLLYLDKQIINIKFEIQ